MKLRITKRGELWSCCSRWQHGDECKCEPYIVEMFDGAGAELHAKAEGPRKSGPEARS